MKCSDGEKCVKGSCEKDKCLSEKGALCKFQRQCRNSKCIDDPCSGVQCAKGQTCREGVCYGKPTPQEKPDEQPGEGGETDGGTTDGKTTDSGQADKSTGDKSSAEKVVDVALPAGGCSCSVTSSNNNAPFFLLLVLFAMFVSSRRRRK